MRLCAASKPSPRLGPTAYAPLLPDLAAVRRACKLEVPLNVLATGALTRISRTEFAEAGVARISLGSGLARLAHAAIRDAARDILDGGDFHRLSGGASGAEIDALLAKGARPA